MKCYDRIDPERQNGQIIGPIFRNMEKRKKVSNSLVTMRVFKTWIFFQTALQSINIQIFN